jgi:hypothetical protein
VRTTASIACATTPSIVGKLEVVGRKAISFVHEKNICLFIQKRNIAPCRETEYKVAIPNKYMFRSMSGILDKLAKTGNIHGHGILLALKGNTTSG